MSFYIRFRNRCAVRAARESPPSQAQKDAGSLLACRRDEESMEDGTTEEKQKLMDKEEVPEAKKQSKRDGTRYFPLTRLHASLIHACCEWLAAYTQ